MCDKMSIITYSSDKLFHAFFFSNISILCHLQIRALQAEHYEAANSQNTGTGDITQDTDKTGASQGMGTDTQTATQQQVILNSYVPSFQQHLIIYAYQLTIADL